MKMPPTGHHLPIRMREQYSAYACLFLLVPPGASQEPWYEVSITGRNFMQISYLSAVTVNDLSHSAALAVYIWVYHPATVWISCPYPSYMVLSLATSVCSYRQIVPHKRQCFICSHVPTTAPPQHIATPLPSGCLL